MSECEFKSKMARESSAELVAAHVCRGLREKKREEFQADRIVKGAHDCAFQAGRVWRVPTRISINIPHRKPGGNEARLALKR